MEAPVSAPKSPSTILFMIVAAGLLVAGMGVSIYSVIQHSQRKTTDTALAEKAFGDLTDGSSDYSGSAESASYITGGAGAVISDTSMRSSDGSDMVYPPEYQYYSYEFGTLPEYDAKMDVYRPVMKKLPNTLFEQSISSALDSTKFKIGAFDSISFRLTEPNFSVNVNSDGEITMYSNATYDTPVTQEYQVDPAKIDEPAAIATATSFLQSLGVNLSTYGTPVVRASDKMLYTANIERKNDFARGVTATVGIIFPDRLNGKPVFDQNGEMAGIMVSIQVPDQHVTTVTGITTHSYEHSAYETRSMESLRNSITHGGYNGFISGYGGGTEIKTSLGSEYISSYLKVSVYQDNIYKTYYLPAYAFKNTINRDNANFYGWVPEYIVAPLIKGFTNGNGSSSAATSAGGF